MRYLIAFMIAAAIILGTKVCQRWSDAFVLRTVRQSIRDAQAAGKPGLDGIDPETADLSATDIPEIFIMQASISRMLKKLWFIWMPLILGACLGAAWLRGNKK